MYFLTCGVSPFFSELFTAQTAGVAAEVSWVVLFHVFRSRPHGGMREDGSDPISQGVVVEVWNAEETFGDLEHPACEYTELEP